jgi:peroxiredoxin
MLDDLKAWEARPPKGAPRLLVVSTGTPEANQSLGLRSPVVLDQGFTVGSAYGTSGTPSAVLVDAKGKIASEVVAGAQGVLALASGQLPRANAAAGGGNGAAAPATPKVGDPAPPFKLPGLDGKPVALADFRGSNTLVLFWNPDCGFCARMLEDLRAWEASAPPGAPKLLVVSTGTPEANQALGLRSPIVLDQGFATGNAFGVSGTPSAVLVDAKGNIASEVAVGAPAVLALANPVPV